MYMENTIFTESFISYIYLDFDYIFPLLNLNEKNIIKKMMLSILKLIYYKFHFESEVQFYNQLSKNNNQDIRMILFLLFPFIDDKNNFQIHKSIINLKDLSVRTNTNIQYDRYFKNKEDDEKRVKEYEYNILDIYNNYIAAHYTINKCAHHLYCNWTQIIPLTLSNYTDSYIYKDTIDTIQEKKIPNNSSLKGLDVRDYYHSFINDMYLDILQYKWLIYEKYDTSIGKDVMYLEEIINYFNTSTNNIFNISELEETNNTNKNTFITKWDSFVSMNSHDIIYNILLHFNTQIYEYLPDDLTNSIIPIIKDRNNEIYNLDDNNDQFANISKDELKILLLQTYNNQDCIPLIYHFLCDTFYKFSFTWYGKLIFPTKIFNTNSIVYLKDQIFNKTKIFNTPIYNNSYVSYKNIYNFTKSLLLTDTSDKKIFIKYPVKDWDALSNNNKEILLYRLNSGNSEWFNISNNLRIKYSNINTVPIRNKIFTSISSNITDLVFHSLVSRGILNEFKVNHSEKAIKESFDGYYFITQAKYNESYYFRKSEKDLRTSCFTDDVINNPKSFKNMFALNWIQQIHFFKHFFHQRVIYVTGGTGTGKSTQVPKLLLYGLYLIGNYDGKVINTQPRINATTKNAERISEELGIPVVEYNYNTKKISKTKFYNVQYSTGGTEDNSKHDQSTIENALKVSSYLNIVTDGTLLELVRKSPFFRKTYKDNNNNLIESDLNEYDIISIDEAHEHNENMDLLLTFFRDTIKLNNSLRLVIITATIDADEPTYRRYYKYINDNLLYPLNNVLFSDVRDSNSYNNINMLTDIYKYLDITMDKYNVAFDRISIDRRLHISPPLSTTIYEIKEHYESKDILSYGDAEPIAIQKAIELTKISTGDILLFSITETAINKIVTELNNSTIGSTWIALPYYRKLSSKWKNIIENIDTMISNVDIDKRDVILACTSTDKDKTYRTVPKNTYQRVIIVSTNIAEASITINTLKYVIDTGYVNSVSFDPVLKISKNGPENISESSRIQRRGRVGRVSNGIVYYIYKKGSRENTPVNYNITQNIDKLVYKLINYIKEGIILSKDGNEVNEELILADNNPESIIKIYLENIINQFTSEVGKIYTNNFDGNPYLRNNMINAMDNVFSYKYKTGYHYQNILDDTGEFYIIHPLENRYNRDPLTGRFINPPEKTNKIFKQYFSNLFKLRLIIINDRVLIKTKVYNILDELKQNIGKIIPIEEINYNILWSMILGSRYNLLDEVIWSNIIINKSSIEKMSMKFSTKKGYQLSDNNLLIKHFGNVNSDISVYVNIFKKLRLVLPKLVIMNPVTITDEYNKSRLNKKSQLSLDTINIIKNIENRNKNQMQLLCIFQNENEIDEGRVKLWCDQYGLDPDEILILLKIYIRHHKTVNMINEWVKKYNNYIPFFDNIGIDFIYISSYVNYASSNIDDQTDIKKSYKDPFSIVTGNKIDALLKELKKDKIYIKHLISYNDIVHLPAIIPALIYPLENNLFIWKDIYLFYKYVTSDMIEKYILPETEKNKADNKRNKLFNTQLLHLFRLLREKI